MAAIWGGKLQLHSTSFNLKYLRVDPSPVETLVLGEVTAVTGLATSDSSGLDASCRGLADATAAVDGAAVVGMAKLLAIR